MAGGSLTAERKKREEQEASAAFFLLVHVLWLRFDTPTATNPNARFKSPSPTSPCPPSCKMPAMHAGVVSRNLQRERVSVMVSLSRLEVA